ncbi:MAG: PPOX class F420-dependent oxidoreductase [Pseudonocardiales bacterium]|nr:MAG: PPOX class F420-dependent oxidoreductase [Pseudonocardiales bacterium]
MSPSLPEFAKELLDAASYVTVATVMPDGSPQTSVLWATYDGEELLLSTIVGRAKERNWRRDPRTSVLIHDAHDPNRFVEVRGTVAMTTDGGAELINRLCMAYYGEPFTGDEGTENVRVVARVTPTRVIVR